MLTRVDVSSAHKPPRVRSARASFVSLGSERRGRDGIVIWEMRGFRRTIWQMAAYGAVPFWWDGDDCPGHVTSGQEGRRQRVVSATENE